MTAKRKPVPPPFPSAEDLSKEAARLFARAVEVGDIALVDVRDAARAGSITAARVLDELRRRRQGGGE